MFTLKSMFSYTCSHADLFVSMENDSDSESCVVGLEILQGITINQKLMKAMYSGRPLTTPQHVCSVNN